MISSESIMFRVQKKADIKTIGRTFPAASDYFWEKSETASSPTLSLPAGECPPGAGRIVGGFMPE